VRFGYFYMSEAALLLTAPSYMQREGCATVFFFRNSVRIPRCWPWTVFRGEISFACFSVLCAFALGIEGVRLNTQRKGAKDRKAREGPITRLQASNPISRSDDAQMSNRIGGRLPGNLGRSKVCSFILLHPLIQSPECLAFGLILIRRFVLAL